MAPSGHNYVYLAPEDASPPEAASFTAVSWEFLTSPFQRFLQDSQGEYPFRTTVQLNDFVDTVRTELTMTEYQENRTEKVALAVEHYDSIVEVLDALEEFCSDLQERWPDWFTERTPVGWDNTWNAPETTNSYFNTYRDGWVIGPDDGDIQNSALFVQWEFRIADRYIGQHQIVHRLKLEGANKQLKQRFRDAFYEEQNHRRVSETLVDIRNDPSKSVEIEEGTSNKRLVSGTYEFTFDGGDGVADTVVAAYEDLSPVFDVVSESIPK